MEKVSSKIALDKSNLSQNTTVGSDDIELGVLDSSKTKLQKSSPSSSNSSSRGDCYILVSRWEESRAHSRMFDMWEEHKSLILMVLLIVFCIAWSIIGFFHIGFERSSGLFGLGLFLWFCVCYALVRDFLGDKIYDACMAPIAKVVKQNWKYIKWVVWGALIILIILWLVFDTSKDPRRFISLGGLIIFIVLSYLFSKHRSKVQWRPVLWGLGLQFVFGLLILRTKVGFESFKFLGNQVEQFLLYTDKGSQFVFGEKTYFQHFFAFKVLPVVVFFSSFVSVVYYLGIMQIVIVKIAWLMQLTMGTSAAESLNAAGNIFIGQTEAPLLIRPFLERMTMSELHAVMTGGFATIAGSVMAAFILFGVSAPHLISASVMSAPAALAMSKLLYPETEEPETANEETIEIPEPTERNIIEAAAKGASLSVPLVANIAANLIAFLAFLALIDGILGYLGSFVNVPDLSFKVICSYVLRPVAFMMGVDWEDTPIVAELLGIKTFLNEFVAYDNFAREHMANNALSPRSEVITVYALCGFANVGSIGIQLGGIGAMAPSRRGDMAKVAVRALICGTVACFLTACIAGILYDETLYEEGSQVVIAAVNSTVAAVNSTAV